MRLVQIQKVNSLERMTVDMLQNLSFDDSIFILFLTQPGTGFLACSTNSGYCSLPVNSSFFTGTGAAS